MDLEQYGNIATAIQVLKQARRTLNAEDGQGVTSPGWTLVIHAQRYLQALARAGGRGDGAFYYRGLKVRL